MRKHLGYEWVTQEMFDRALEKLVDDMTSLEVFAIPGVAQIVSAHLNDDVLEELEHEREMT